MHSAPDGVDNGGASQFCHHEHREGSGLLLARRILRSFAILAVVLAVTVAMMNMHATIATARDEPPTAERVREVTELRTATSKTYELGDGNREWVGYAEPVHYKDDCGT